MRFATTRRSTTTSRTQGMQAAWPGRTPTAAPRRTPRDPCLTPRSNRRQQIICKYFHHHVDPVHASLLAAMYRMHEYVLITSITTTTAVTATPFSPSSPAEISRIATTTTRPTTAFLICRTRLPLSAWRPQQPPLPWPRRHRLLPVAAAAAAAEATPEEVERIGTTWTRPPTRSSLDTHQTLDP